MSGSGRLAARMGDDGERTDSEEYQKWGDTIPLPPPFPFVAQRQQQTKEGQCGSHDPLFNGSSDEEGVGDERGTATPPTPATAGRGSMGAFTTTTEAMNEGSDIDSVDSEDTESKEEDNDDEDEEDEDIERLLGFLHVAAKRGVWGCNGCLLQPSCRTSVAQAHVHRCV